MLAPLAAVPLYILIARPSGKRLALFAAGGAVLVGLAAAALWARYGEIPGKPFDEYSRVYSGQQIARSRPRRLRAQHPQPGRMFFEYGLRWFVPYAGWMSINTPPPSHGRRFAAPRRRRVRHRGDWRLSSVAALIATGARSPAFRCSCRRRSCKPSSRLLRRIRSVLYRSYLGDRAAGLVLCLVQGPPPRRSHRRLRRRRAPSLAGARPRSSMTHPSVFSDAIAKPRDPRAVGRWFRTSIAATPTDATCPRRHEGLRSSAASAIGAWAFNLGSMLSMTGRHQQALAAFERAEKQGYDLYNLPSSGPSLMAIGELAS